MRIHLRALVACCAIFLVRPCAADRWDSWKDRSPHTSGFVNVNGIRLNYLDWGGRGETMLFLNGWQDTAHCFDDLAPRFRDHFHCIAFTRRGYGQSDKPAKGYTNAELVDEVIGFMDARGIDRAVLVGHSAGGLLSLLTAARHPDRVIAVVSLDGLIDRTLTEFGPVETTSAKLTFPDPGTSDLASLAAYRRFSQRFYSFGTPPRPFWTAALEAEMRDLVRVKADGSVELLTPAGQDAAASKEWHEDTRLSAIPYGMLRCPVLCFVCHGGLDQFYHAALGLASAEEVQAADRAFSAWKRACSTRFRQGTANGRILDLPDTHHYCFVQRLIRVAEEMRHFLGADDHRFGDSVDAPGFVR